MECAITQDKLFDKWCDRQDEPELLAGLLGITPSQLADLVDDPVFVRRVAAWERLNRLRRESLVFNHQQAAANTLRETMSSPDPIEARRAATVLARLCRNMQMPIAGGTSRRGTAQGGPALQNSASDGGTAPGGTALGGTALQSSASDSPTAPQEPSLPTPSSQPSLTPEPPTPSHPLTAPPPLPFTASPPHIVTKLAALAALAGTAPVARASGP